MITDINLLKAIRLRINFTIEDFSNSTILTKNDILDIEKGNVYNPYYQIYVLKLNELNK